MNLDYLSNDIATRALLAVFIIAGGLAVYWLYNRALLARAGRSSDSPLSNLPGARPGTPAILYFTAPGCAPCRTIQRPALERVQAYLGDRLQVIEIDAQEMPDIANRWGVLSVPTTFLLDSSGALKHVNHGATRAEKLLQQMRETGTLGG